MVTYMNKRQGRSISIALLVILSVTLAYPFILGYRLTADDIYFHQKVMNGWSDLWSFIRDFSVAQGRIVNFVALPFSTVSAYYAENLYFRLVYTGLYFSNFVLLAIYLSVLSRFRNITYFVIFITLILLSLHPLDYYHLAPTAYPVHISLPIALIISARLMLLRVRERLSNEFSYLEYLALLLCFFGMMFSEYGFLVALSLIISEGIVRVFRLYKIKGKLGIAIVSFLKSKVFIKDLTLLLLFFILYVGYRLFHPSTYEGNKISSDIDALLMVKTLVGHIYGGTSIASFVRYKELIFQELMGYSVWNWLVLISIFTISYILVFLCLRGLIKDLCLYKYKFFIGISIVSSLCSILVTLPIALTEKYQNWCGNINSCIFIDSRISYLGVGVALSSLLLLFFKLSLREKIFSIILALFISIGTSFTYVNNLRIGKDMKQFVSAWDRATYMSCIPANTLKIFELSRIVDPFHRIRYHPGFDVNKYWNDYIELQRNKVECDRSSISNLAYFFPQLPVESKVDTRSGEEALVFLSKGWSSPESWGTWSNGDSAEVYLPLEMNASRVVFEIVGFVTQEFPKQKVKIKINGEPVKVVVLSSSDRTSISLKVPSDLNTKNSFRQLVKFGFEFSNAIRPSDLGLSNDERKLAIGLISISVR